MSHPLRIGLDIDGVIAEYKEIAPEDRTTATYNKLKPVSPEVMATFAALAMCCEVFLISSRRYPEAQMHTLKWLKDWLPEWAKGVRFELLTDVAPKDKWMVVEALKLDVLVDDNEEVFDVNPFGDDSDPFYRCTKVIVGSGVGYAQEYSRYWGVPNLALLPEILTSLGWRTKFEWIWYAKDGEDIFLPARLEFQPYLRKSMWTAFGLDSCVGVSMDDKTRLSRTRWVDAVRAAREAAAVL